jgi:hypothetical protein
MVEILIVTLAGRESRVRDEGTVKEEGMETGGMKQFCFDPR